MDAKVATLKAALDRQSQKEHRLRTTVTVLLSRSENQILVLETLLKRLVQVCVHTQDRRLAKELKLIDFTRLAKTLSVDHMHLRQLIGPDDALDMRYLDNLNMGKRGMSAVDDILPPNTQGFRGDATHMASPSGRRTPDLIQPRRGDSSGHDNGPGASLGNLWNSDGMSMQGMQFPNNAGAASQQQQQQHPQQPPQMMRSQGMGMTRSNGSMTVPSPGMMRDNLGNGGMF